MGQRGARYVDFPRWLDQHVSALDSLTTANRVAQYEHLRAFYFDEVADSTRQRQWAPPR